MTLLAAYLIFILDCENDVRQKQIEKFSYLSSKWVVKHQRQLETANTSLAQELLMNIQCTGGSRSLSKETRALKMRSTVASYQKLTTTNWEQSSKLTIIWEVSKEWDIKHSMVVQHLKQIGNVKKLNKWMPLELTENLKNKTVFWSALLLFYAIRMNHFSIGLWCMMKSGFYTTGNDQLSVWTEKKLQSTFQSQTYIRKRLWSLFGGLLPIWSTIAFWILTKPHYIWEVYPANWWDAVKTSMPAASIVQQKRAQILLHNNDWPQVTQPKLQKLKELG